uniref:Uncharacterized protein n=1 Tax=Anopheles culicifacies TaxID=139723 RepID=A0A182LV28_9DIPT
MASIGKVKSEYTISGRTVSRSGTPTALKTPANTRIPKSISSTSPQNGVDRKFFISRRKLEISSPKSNLTLSSPSSTVQNIVYHDASDKRNVCSYEKDTIPNCTFVNICNEHQQGTFEWRKYLWTLWTCVGRVAQILLGVLLVFLACNGALHGIFWLLGGIDEKAVSEQMDDIIEPDEDEVGRNLMVLNLKENSSEKTAPVRTPREFPQTSTICNRYPVSGPVPVGILRFDDVTDLRSRRQRTTTKREQAASNPAGSFVVGIRFPLIRLSCSVSRSSAGLYRRYREQELKAVRRMRGCKI